MSDDEAGIRQSRIEHHLAELAGLIGPLETLAYVERVAERMREELEEAGLHEPGD